MGNKWDMVKRFKEKNKGGHTVSIIVVTRDLTDEKLNKCLRSISFQSYQDIELILEWKGDIQTARQNGIKRAKGKYICFVDSDQVLPKDLIMECEGYCRQGADGVTWTERSINLDTFCEKVIDYDKFLFHLQCDDDPIKGAAEPRFFKSDFVKKIDFYKLPPVTFELAGINKQIHDMGAKIWFIETIVHHHEPRTFRELFRKFFRYGYYYIPALKLDKELVLNHSKPRRSYYNLRAFTNHPTLYLGLWYHFLVKATGTLGGVIWYLVKH